MNVSLHFISNPRSLEEKIVTRSLGGGGGGSIGPPFYFRHNSSDWHKIWYIKFGTYNKLYLYFKVSETTWCLIGFHGNNSQINDVTGGRHLGFWNFQILFKFSLLYLKLTGNQHLAVEVHEMAGIHCEIVTIVYLAKNWDFAVNTQIAWLFTMTSSLMTSLN